MTYTKFHKYADDQGMPCRTLEQVKAALAQARKNKCEPEMLRIMLNHGRITDEARTYLEGVKL